MIELSPQELDRLEALFQAAHLQLGKGPWTRAQPETWINAPSKLGGSSAHVADIRGWGYLTGRGHALALDEDTAFAAQKLWGDLIVSAVNALMPLIAQARASSPAPPGEGEEPVAWMWETNGPKGWYACAGIRAPDQPPSFIRNVQPLYAAPPHPRGGTPYGEGEGIRAKYPVISFLPSCEEHNAVLSPEEPHEGPYFTLIGCGDTDTQNRLAEKFIQAFNALSAPPTLGGEGNQGVSSGDIQNDRGEDVPPADLGAIAATTHQEVAKARGFSLVGHIYRARKFSAATFGPGGNPTRPLNHIRKEVEEIAAEPFDLEEWADLIILGLDGAWRAGHSPEAIVCAIEAKQTKNEGRKWPDWRTVPGDQPIEHNRSEDR